MRAAAAAAAAAAVIMLLIYWVIHGGAPQANHALLLLLRPASQLSHVPAGPRGTIHTPSLVCAPPPPPLASAPAELSQLPTLLYGTINGVLGLVASLPQPTYALLESLQVRGRLRAGSGALEVQ